MSDSGKPSKKYGISIGLMLLFWAVILAYIPSYFGFAEHWPAYIFFVTSALVGLIGIGGTLLEAARLLPAGLVGLNENMAVGLFLVAVAAGAHFAGRASPWAWLDYVLRVVAVGTMIVATVGIAMSVEDSIKATLSRQAEGRQGRVLDAIKTILAFVVGFLGAAAAAVELYRAFS